MFRKNYADYLYDIGIIHLSARIVEGCVGNTGWGASLAVVKYLGKDAEYYIVDLDSQQLEVHKRMFLSNYKSSSLNGRPKLEWVVGPIEDQEKLIKKCDALLFHNYFPPDRETLGGKREGNIERIRSVFDRILKAKPKHIAIFLPYSKTPERVAKFILDPLGVDYEIVDNIDYGGQLEEKEYDEWRGQLIII